jgi:hypothetical protein
MKKVVLFLLVGGFLYSVAQNTKTVKVDPQKSAQIRAELEKAYPPKPAPAKKTQTTKTVTTKNAAGKKTEAKSSTPVKPFSFTGSFTMKFDDRNKQGHYNMGKIVYALDSIQAAIIPTFEKMKEVPYMRAVINMQEKEMTLLTADVKGKKNGLLMKLPKPIVKKPDPKAKLPVMKKTGETKVIEGYKCERILVTDTAGNKIDSWVTAEIQLNLYQLVTLANSGFRGKSPFSNTDVSDIKGTALETTITRTDGGVMKITLSEIKKVKPAPTFFSTDGFKISDVRGLPMFGGQ